MIKFYPGSLLLKRLAYLGIVFTIGANLFLDRVQNQLLDMGEEMILLSDTLSGSAIYSVSIIEQRILPLVSAIEKSWFSDWLESYEVPSSGAITEGIDQVYRFKEHLGRYGPFFTLVASVIRWTSIFIWIPIFFALLWLYFDLRKGNAKVLVATGLLISIPANYFIYVGLMSLI